MASWEGFSLIPNLGEVSSPVGFFTFTTSVKTCFFFVPQKQRFGGGKSFLVQKLGILPGKLTWNPKNGALEDDFPLQTGDVQVPC